MSVSISADCCTHISRYDFASSNTIEEYLHIEIQQLATLLFTWSERLSTTIHSSDLHLVRPSRHESLALLTLPTTIRRGCRSRGIAGASSGSHLHRDSPPEGPHRILAFDHAKVAHAGDGTGAYGVRGHRGYEWLKTRLARGRRLQNTVTSTHEIRIRGGADALRTGDIRRDRHRHERGALRRGIDAAREGPRPVGIDLVQVHGDDATCGDLREGSTRYGHRCRERGGGVDVAPAGRFAKARGLGAGEYGDVRLGVAGVGGDAEGGARSAEVALGGGDLAVAGYGGGECEG